MKYYTRESIELEDYVELSSNVFGIVVAIIQESKYSKLYPKEEWDYLEYGLLVLSDQAGLIHYPQVTEEITFVNHNQDK
ncbi:hypothetical protein OZX61_07255 [Acinetobacter sp. ESL0695]|uniref:hypothetical protein n=1 Tax=Acinetobacter sp. ESL0695 TaxID=2983215 RepID=UPI0023F45356|nr:hypothetical protein [Acinetobacter sp. ESL0695]WEV48086.1 hypothetical protein OZX61_07255 [Acinetobacter sp. ESL0695]